MDLLKILTTGLSAAAVVVGASATAPADTITLASKLLPEPMKVTVARPDGPGPFPTLYLLNGHGGHHRTWPSLVDIDSVAEANQWVVVCPSGMNSWYWDSPERPDMKMESFFTTELVAAIDSLYPTISDPKARAITGLSMGGHGSLWLALRHPDIWGHAGSTSGGVDVRPFPGSWRLSSLIGERDSVPEVWYSHTVRSLVDTLPDSVLRSVDMTIDCGTDDFFYTVNCQLDSVLSARHIPHVFATSPGAHNGAYWSRSIIPQLNHFTLTMTNNRSAGARTVEIGSPRMKVFLPSPELATGRAVICCPGGGYVWVATEHEGYAWAPFFNSLGIALAVVDYQMPQGDRTIPLGDIERAFKLMTDSASAWHINPDDIGIMGFSAGGHLASSVATHNPGGVKPAFQILFYPVISLDNSITHRGTRNGFLGPEPDDALVSEWSSDRAVNNSTPRAIIILSGDDQTVPPANSLNYYSALRSAGIPAELHILPSGGHGWGYKPDSPDFGVVIAALRAFLTR